MGIYSKDQMSIVIAMTLGDSCITKFRKKRANSFLSTQHSFKQKEYMKFKMNLLKDLRFKISKIYDVSVLFKSIRFDCRDSILFNQLRACLYPKNNKTIKRRWLNYLNKQGLAIWYMDDGSLTKRGKSGYISLHTNSFNKKEHDIIIRYFKQVWSINPTLRITKRKNRDQSFFLVFNPDETRKFLKIVKPYVCDSMLYKVDFI